MSSKRLAVLLVAVLCGAGLATGQTEWVDDPNSPIFEPGPPGSWDEGGHWARAAFFDGSMYHLWFTGSNSNGNPTDMGHATSPDGAVWTMDPANPVLTRGDSGEWDESRLDGAAVVHDGSLFHMWYSGLDADFFERAGYATSPDGTVWTKHASNPVMDVGPPGSWDDDYIRPTSVMVDDGAYRMWYGGGTYTGTANEYSVGYAESDDGVTWIKREEPVLSPSTYPGAWDPGVASNPYIVFDGTVYHMWYTGGEESTSAVEVSIGYAYSRDGIEWTKHRGNPVVGSSPVLTWHSPVLYDGSTWHMWYTHRDGSPDLITYATSVRGAGVADLNNWQFIPAAAVASGAEGAFFQTDVDVSNADDQTAEYQFMWLPRGEDNTEPTTSESFTLGGGKSARYANVLTEVFGLEPDSFGALGIRSTSTDLLAMSRTYNLGDDGSEGTYGQAMPALTTDEFIQQGATRRILFGSENADMRTNVGCQNGVDSMTVVYLDLYKADGTSLGRKTLMLRALGNDQVNRIFDGHNPMNGYVDVTPAQTDKPVFCYGSVLDNMTSDPTTIQPQ